MAAPLGLWSIATSSALESTSARWWASKWLNSQPIIAFRSPLQWNYSRNYAGLPSTRPSKTWPMTRAFYRRLSSHSIRLCKPWWTTHNSCHHLWWRSAITTLNSGTGLPSNWWIHRANCSTLNCWLRLSHLIKWNKLNRRGSKSCTNTWYQNCRLWIRRITNLRTSYCSSKWLRLLTLIAMPCY